MFLSPYRDPQGSKAGANQIFSNVWRTWRCFKCIIGRWRREGITNAVAVKVAIGVAVYHKVSFAIGKADEVRV